MRRKRILIVLAVCVLIGIGVVALLPEREPQYNGKKLSEWMDVPSRGIDSRHTAQVAEAIKAIRAIGTNALPCLLRWAELENPNWLWRTAERCKNFGFNWPQRFVFLKVRQRANAWTALHILGRTASPAIPAVGRIAMNSPSPEYAIAFLSDIGPDGIPELLRVIARGKGERRLRAMDFIKLVPDLGTNGPAVAKVLLNCMGDSDQDIAGCAADLLGVMSLEPKIAVPALVERLQDERVSVRYRASRALENLAVKNVAVADLRDAVPALVTAREDPDFTIRDSVTRVLQKIAPEVLTNGVKDF